MNLVVAKKRVTYLVKDRQPCGWNYGYLNIPMPHYLSEFDILSELVWGTKIGIQELSLSGKNCQYRIGKPYDSYGPQVQKEFAKHHRGGFGSYSLNEYFCAAIFGKLYCGGIGGYAYGQTHLRSYRHKVALEKLVEDIKKVKERRHEPRGHFLRLAEQKRSSER